MISPLMSIHPIISNAKYGMTLNVRMKILNNPRNEYITRVKDSLGMGNHLYWVRYTQSIANIHIIVHNNNNAPFMIMHHMKKVLRV